jgi:apolipoprotein N-acyltransferase
VPHTGTAAVGPDQLALLQGNIPQNEKFEAGSGVPMALQWYAEQLRSAKASSWWRPKPPFRCCPSS